MRTLPSALFLSVFLAPDALLAQCDQGTSLTSPGSASNGFGVGVDLHDNLLLVGDANAKAAYLYQRQATDWVFLAKLQEQQPTAPATGSEVDFGGPSRAFVGAYNESSPGTDDHGMVLVFEDTGNGWAQTAKLLPSDLQEYGQFGYCAAGDGDWLLVGAPGRNTSEGAAYFFEYVGGQWIERQVVVPTPGAVRQNAWEVALQGNLAVVTTLRESLNYGWGMLHVYELVNGVWTHLEALEAPIPHGADWVHGQSLAIVGDRIVAGTIKAYEDSADMAFVWERGASGFEVTAILTPSLSAPAPDFGIHVAAAGQRIAVASRDRIHLFDEVDGTWLRSVDIDLDLDATSLHGLFPNRLGISENEFAIGQPNFPDHPGGRVLVVDRSPQVNVYCPGSACPCGNNDEHAGCANSTGAGAWIEACGSTRVSTDDLTLRVTGLPTNQFCLMFMGAGEQSTPLGSGKLCVAPGGVGLFRYTPPLYSGTSGSVTLGPGIVARSQAFAVAGRIAAGQSWKFQSWGRDPGGPCGAHYGTSSAVSVTFLP